MSQNRYRYRNGTTATETMMFLSLILFVISNAISAFFRPCLQLSFLDLKVFLKKEQYDSKFPLNYGLGREQIVYLDDDIVVVNKPPHALSVPGVRSNDSVASRIARLLKIESVDTMIVHRLDYATSGILLLARNYPSLLSLNTQFRRPNVVSKAYVAVVGGKVNCSEGEVRLPLSQDLDRGYPYCKVSFEGKESLTLWQNLFSVNNNSILRLFPITGR